MSTMPLYLQRSRQDLEDLNRSMRNKASLGGVLAFLTGHSRTLIDLTAKLSGRTICSRHYAGTQTVSINRIKGSEGRTVDFDSDFNPLHERTINRWLSVASAHSAGTVLPPVELIQVGADYFVRDGHHRISVARAFGEEYIDAEVTVLALAPDFVHPPTLAIKPLSSWITLCTRPANDGRIAPPVPPVVRMTYANCLTPLNRLERLDAVESQCQA